MSRTKKPLLVAVPKPERGPAAGDPYPLEWTQYLTVGELRRIVNDARLFDSDLTNVGSAQVDGGRLNLNR